MCVAFFIAIVVTYPVVIFKNGFFHHCHIESPGSNGFFTFFRLLENSYVVSSLLLETVTGTFIVI